MAVQGRSPSPESPVRRRDSVIEKLGSRKSIIGTFEEVFKVFPGLPAGGGGRERKGDAAAPGGCCENAN